MQTYQILARAIGALARCEAANSQEWSVKWQSRIDELMEDFPHGSGFDRGTKLDDSSTPEKLVFTTAFHHMDENGMYDGWTEHSVIVTPSLEMDFSIRVTGRNRNGIKEYIAELFSRVLSEQQDEFNQQSQTA